MANAISQPVASPGFLDQAYTTASNVTNWIKEGVKSGAASASDLGTRAWAAFCDALASLKETFFAAKDSFAALPTNVKILYGTTALLVLAAGYLLARSCAPAAQGQSQSSSASQTASSSASTDAASSAASAAASAVLQVQASASATV